MERICKNCYCYKPDSNYSDKINCLNDFGKVEETDTCIDFCKEEDYIPTGIWAEVAKVVEAVAQKIKINENNYEE